MQADSDNACNLKPPNHARATAWIGLVAGIVVLLIRRYIVGIPFEFALLAGLLIVITTAGRRDPPPFLRLSRLGMRKKRSGGSH